MAPFQSHEGWAGTGSKDAKITGHAKVENIDVYSRHPVLEVLVLIGVCHESAWPSQSMVTVKISMSDAATESPRQMQTQDGGCNRTHQPRV